MDRPNPDGSSTQGDSGAIHQRAVRASMWVLGSRPVFMGLQLARSLVLTRVLFPEAFGVMALVGVILSGLQMCSDTGIRANIVQSQRGDDAEFLQTAWTLGILRGFALWLICCAVAFPVAQAYGEQQLLWLLPVCGLSVLFKSFESTAAATHDRALLRRRLTMVQFGSEVAGTIIVILLAFALRSVWALAVGQIIGVALGVTAGHIFLPGVRHRFRWEREAVHEIVHFGKWVFVSTLLTFFAMQIDKLLLGKLVPMTLLGVYSVALVLAGVPRDLIRSVATTIFFPALAELKRRKQGSIRDQFKRARGVLLQAGLVLTIGAAASAPAFFGYLYDSRYLDAGWIAQLLSISTWFTVLNYMTSNALLALGDSKALAFGNAVNVAVTLVAALVGFHLHGLPGFIVGYATGTACGEVAMGVRLKKHGVDVLRQDLRFSAAVVVCVALMWASKSVLPTLLNAPLAPWLETVFGLLIWLPVAVVALPSIRRVVWPRASTSTS